MLHAYAGIVTSDGLEVFVPEHRHTFQFLRRWADRHPQPASCFWAVLAPKDADTVTQQLWMDNRIGAWRSLRTSAFQLGPLVSGDEDDWAA